MVPSARGTRAKATCHVTWFVGDWAVRGPGTVAFEGRHSNGVDAVFVSIVRIVRLRLVWLMRSCRCGVTKTGLKRKVGLSRCDVNLEPGVEIIHRFSRTTFARARHWVGAPLPWEGASCRKSGSCAGP